MVKALTEANIVVIDDDYNATYTTVAYLKQHGVQHTHTFYNADEVLDFVHETSETIDMFLVDIHLPGRSGHDLLKALRTISKVSEAKIVAITGGVLFMDIQKAQESGFDAFLGKPIKPIDFPNQLTQILAGESVWDW
ncbi:MAG: response regulator [Chloroflexota bacterium]